MEAIAEPPSLEELAGRLVLVTRDREKGTWRIATDGMHQLDVLDAVIFDVSFKLDPEFDTLCGRNGWVGGAQGKLLTEQEAAEIDFSKAERLIFCGEDGFYFTRQHPDTHVRNVRFLQLRRSGSNRAIR